MINIADYFKADPDAFKRGYDRVNALQADRARMQAGSALSGGDYRGAANALYGSGDVTGGLRVTESGQQRDAKAAELKREQEEAFWKTTGDIAGRLMNVYRNNPAAVVEQFDALAPRLQQLGETPDEIAQTRAQLVADPESVLIRLGAAAEQKIKTYGDSRGGVYVVDEAALGRDFNAPDAVRTLREPYRDPLDEELKQARIEATRAQVGQREAAAEKSRRTGGGGGGGTAKRSASEMSDAELMAIVKGGK